MITNKIKLQVNFKNGQNCCMSQKDVTAFSKTND